MTIDLGGPHRVGGIVMSFGSAGSSFPRELIIETSADDPGERRQGVPVDREWTGVWRGSPAAAVLRAALESPAETRVELRFRRHDARFIRLRQVGRVDRFWSMAELSVWSD
jgi:hypothetical protein